MTLGEYLTEETISLNLEAETSSDVIRHLGNKLFDCGLVKESFIEAAISREQNLPTGLPLEEDLHVAIPHTDIEHVNKPGLAMATLSKPVVFQNMVDPSDSVNVSIVFLMALDEPHAQIAMLQEIAGVIQDGELLKRLVKAQDARDVIREFTAICK